MMDIDALTTEVLRRRNTAQTARQMYDDASAGVDHDPLHNAAQRLHAADQLSEATYELVHWLDNLLELDSGNLMLYLLEYQRPGRQR